MIITLSGLPGSGTSTVADILSSRTGFEVVSAGDIFRKIAEERGLTLEEFGELASSDPDIDQQIDRHQRKIASDAKGIGRDVIIEGRLSAWMAEPDLGVLITAPLEVRAERIVRREGIWVSDAIKQIQKRE
ncbi:MAG TPA: cytidylate kinase, partial [Methanosarcinales archaeon]|nr:cytidylate kinase [Methanosarcinales archaeon]